MTAQKENFLEQLCDVANKSTNPPFRLTAIICTIGPVSRKPDILEKLIAGGMNIARLNFSHGNHEYHAETIQNIRQAVKIYSERQGIEYPLAIAVDTKGPEIRTGTIEGSAGEVELKNKDIVNLTTNIDYLKKSKKDIIYVNYHNIVNVVEPGNRVFLDGGIISLIVTEVSGDSLICNVEMGGILGSRKAVHLPGVAVDLPAVSETDKLDLLFAVEQEVDLIFASLIRDAEGVKEIHAALGPKGKHIKVIPKVGNLQSLNNLDEILAVSEGIIIPRDDLTLEVPREKVFLAQKAIISRCNKAGKSAICSSQMLESMIRMLHADRIEIADIANAIIDGADCVMLAAETSNGKFPIESYTLMAKICMEAEAMLWLKSGLSDLDADSQLPGSLDAAQSIAFSAVEAASRLVAAAIVVITASGKSAQLIAKYRPHCPIIAVTKFPQTARQTQLFRGILPLIYTGQQESEWPRDVDARVQYGISIGKIYGFIHTGSPIVVVMGWKQGSGFTNTMRVIYAYFDDEDLGGCILKKPKKKDKVKGCTSIPLN